MTLKETLDILELKEKINKIWDQIEQNLNDESLKISSEKTLVNGQMYSLKNGASNPLALVQISGL